MNPIVGYIQIINGEPRRLYYNGVLPFVPVFQEPYFLSAHGEEVRKVEVREVKAQRVRKGGLCT